MARTALVISCLAALAALPAPAAASGRDGPGLWITARTLTSTSDPTPSMLRGCSSHFGLLSGATIKQHALAYAVSTNPITGFVSGETGRWLGHAFICAGPNTAGGDPIAAYAQAELAGLGTVELDGTCSLHPNPTKLSYFLGCRQRIVPKPALGLLGGYMMQLATSGSLVSAYVVLKPGTSIPATINPGPTPPHGSLPNPPNFYLYRSFAPSVAAGCRSTALSSTRPSLGNGRLDPNELLYEDARVTLCLRGGNATATMRLRRGGRDVTLTASGNCREVATPAGPDLRQQTCDLPIQSANGVAGSRGGLLTSNGLVPAGKPLEAANDHVWTLALLAPSVTEPSERARPTVMLSLRRRTRQRRVRVRWRGSDVGSQIRSYALQLRRRCRRHPCRWRTVAATTTGTRATLRLRRGRSYFVRVRAVDRAGNVGRWARKRIVVLRPR